MKLNTPNLLRHYAYINSEWVSGASGRDLAVHDPADNSVLGHIPLLDPEQIKSSISAASKAFDTWKCVRSSIRAEILQNWYQQLLEHKDDLATILVREQGKPRAEAEGEVIYAANFVRWFAEEARRTNGQTMPSHINGAVLGTFKEPIGVCALITPWNFPLAMITRKAAAAIAAGCSVIVKPANETPFSAFALAELAERAGIPAGVFNVISGEAAEVSAQLCAEPVIKALSFTGSTRVGKLLLSQCANSVKRVSLELGGNAPFVVGVDVEVDEAVSAVVATKFQTSGQDCLAANRIMVHTSIYDDFIERLKRKVCELRVGPGSHPGSQIGPLIHRSAVEKANALVNDAVAKGARLIYGDQRQAPGENYFMPTLLSDVTPEMAVWKEENFAPVAAVSAYETDDEVLALANDTEYGLAAYLWTHDHQRIWKFIRGLQYGMVAVNSVKMTGPCVPFGGIKHSGLGREGGDTGIDEYMNIKYFCLGNVEQHDG